MSANAVVQTIHIDPLDISFLETDRDLNKPSPKEYSLSLFGPVMKVPTGLTNCPEAMHLAPLRQVGAQRYRLSVLSVSLPAAFCALYNNSATVQIRVTFLAPSGSRTNFEVLSSPKRLEIPTEELKVKKEKSENVILGGFEPIEFSKLLDDQNEKFRISIVYSH